MPAALANGTLYSGPVVHTRGLCSDRPEHGRSPWQVRITTTAGSHQPVDHSRSRTEPAPSVYDGDETRLGIQATWLNGISVFCWSGKDSDRQGHRTGVQHMHIGRFDENVLVCRCCLNAGTGRVSRASQRCTTKCQGRRCVATGAEAWMASLGERARSRQSKCRLETISTPVNYLKCVA